MTPKARPLQNGPAISVTAVDSSPLSSTAMTEAMIISSTADRPAQVVGESQRQQRQPAGDGDDAYGAQSGTDAVGPAPRDDAAQRAEQLRHGDQGTGGLDLPSHGC